MCLIPLAICLLAAQPPEEKKRLNHDIWIHRASYHCFYLGWGTWLANPHSVDGDLCKTCPRCWIKHILCLVYWKMLNSFLLAFFISICALVTIADNTTLNSYITPPSSLLWMKIINKWKDYIMYDSLFEE